jgi:hypothetical protein
MKMKKTRRVTGAVLLAALLFAGCANPAGEGSHTTVDATTTGKPAAINAAPQVTPKGSTGLAVAWESAEGASAYEVYAGTTPESAVKTGGDVAGTSVEIANLSPATAYYIRVRAKNAAGTGPFSPTSAAVSTEAATGNGPEGEGAPPAAIAAAPLALPDGFNRIAVSWTAVEGALSYEVYAGSSPETAVKTGDDVAGTGVILSGLAASTTYYVKVRAKNAAGTGPFSPPSAAARTSDALPSGFLAAQDHWGSGVGDGYKIDASGRIEYLGVESVTDAYQGAYSFAANIKYHVQFPQETVSSRGGEKAGGDSGVFIIEYADPLPTPGGLSLPGSFQAIYYWGLGTNHQGVAYPAGAAKGLPQVFMANAANLAATSPEFANNGEDASTGVNPETQTLSQAIAKFTLEKRNLWVAYGVVYPQMKDFEILY